MKKIILRPEYIVILLMLLIKTGLHLVADLHSGLDGDEVYHVNTGKHLAWGYMEFPPMIGFLAFVQNSFNSVSIFAHHFFVHCGAGLLIIICGLTVIKLGGKWRAVLLCLVCILAGSCFGMTQNAFQPVIFDQLFWVLSFYFLISFIKSNQNRYLIFLALSIALGFLTKYSIMFFATALLLSIIIFQRSILKTKAFWAGILLLLVIISPNFYWQWKNSFPVFLHFSRLYEVQLDKLSFSENIISLILSPNPFTIFVWLPGIFVIQFMPSFKKYRLGLFAIVFSFLLLMAAKGKFYYFYPVVLMSFITGSVLLENLFSSKKWIIYSYIFLLLLITPITATNALPVFPLEKYITFYRVKKNDSGVTPVMDSYSFKITWEKLLVSVKHVYDSLPESEKNNSIIWGDTYSWASGINFYADTYQLPQAISFHGTHYLWVPQFPKGVSMIVVCNSDSKESFKHRLCYYLQYFNKVELKEQILNSFSEDKSDYYLNILYCQDIKYDSKEMKKLLKHRIFE